MEGKYCKWFCTDYVDENKWMFKSRCGEQRVVSRREKFFKHLYKDDDTNFCPNCNRLITVGSLMD